jgi:hypothetical protein
MMSAVASAIADREVLLAEAGTGTGKSLAYLLPAALAGEPVIVSTGTRNLQDQLFHKDVPFVRETLGVPFTAALDRLVTLAGHADTRVRQTAIEAIGTLGGEPAHLEALAGRLTATAEHAEPVRNAAWQALRTILSRKDPAERLQWVERLAETPDRQTVYLDELIKELAALSPPPPALNAARRRLAELHAQRGNFDAAITIGQQLHAALAADNDPAADDAALALLSAALSAGRNDVTKDTLLGLAKSPPETKQEAIGKIKAHIDVHKTKEHAKPTLALIDTLLSLEENAYGKAFGAYLIGVKRQLTPPPPPQTTTSAPAE